MHSVTNSQGITMWKLLSCCSRCLTNHLSRYLRRGELHIGTVSSHNLEHLVSSLRLACSSLPLYQNISRKHEHKKNSSHLQRIGVSNMATSVEKGLLKYNPYTQQYSSIDDLTMNSRTTVHLGYGQKNSLHNTLHMSLFLTRQNKQMKCTSARLRHPSQSTYNLCTKLYISGNSRPFLFSLLGHRNTVRFYRGPARQKKVHSSNGRQEDSDESDNSDDSDDEDLHSGNFLAVHRSASDDDVYSSNLLAVDRKNPADQSNTTAISRDMTESKEMTVARKSVDELTLPELSRVALNIVPYVKRSETLQNLVKLGVNLDKVQRVKGVEELLIKSNFDRDIMPLISFLTCVGVQANHLGHIFTWNPLLFQETPEDLELRVGYLIHKNFTLPDVVSIITRAPIVLLMDPLMLDSKLGFFQHVFGITDKEVRKMVMLCPKLLPWRRKLIADVRFHMKEFIGFTHEEMKQIILKEPRVFIKKTHTLVNNFDYLHNTMLISHAQILLWPGILQTKQYFFKYRHLFLLFCGRAQYDPCLENFVPLKALCTGSDEEFCRDIAKCDIQEFHDFCKTL